jgi:hypothetical protein
MGNHYHLLVESGKPTLSKSMREVNEQCTQAFNRRHHRVGHVLQGRYKALLVEKDPYLTELSCYTVVNPVQSGLVKQVERWSSSSYRAVMGQGDAPAWLAVHRTLELFHGDSGPARRAYARFVADGIGAPDPTLQVRHHIYLATDRFIEEFAGKVPPERLSREIPRTQRAMKTLTAHERDTRSRDEAIRAAYEAGGHTLSQISQHFGLHYSVISRIARRQYATKARGA